MDKNIVTYNVADHSHIVKTVLLDGVDVTDRTYQIGIASEKEGLVYMFSDPREVTEDGYIKCCLQWGAVEVITRKESEWPE